MQLIIVILIALGMSAMWAFPTLTPAIALGVFALLVLLVLTIGAHEGRAK